METDTYHTKPYKRDTGRHGLGDGREVHTTHTNPLVADTDGDQLLDGNEVDGWMDGWMYWID